MQGKCRLIPLYANCTRTKFIRHLLDAESDKDNKDTRLMDISTNMEIFCNIVLKFLNSKQAFNKELRRTC